MQDSLWFSTRSALFRDDDAAWNEVARYAAPLQRLLDRRYALVEANARQDVVQDVLIEIKENLASTYDPDRGKFRALLQTVVHRRVVDHLRRKQPQALTDGIPEPRASDVEALDLETSILEAVAACHDHFSQGRSRDLDVVWTLGDRLVSGLKSVEIARKDGLTLRQVSHRLARAREVIFEQLLARELGLDADASELEAAVTIFRKSLRKPGATTQLLDGLQPGPVRERLETFLQRFWVSLDLFKGDQSAQGQELARGIQVIFEESQGEGAAA